ncbi:MAG: carbohydrate ABC transporter permease [Eubacteriales bacterium]|nr:carbohydrate ABC transporter permease [Eubacteriales bacterium]
MKIRKTAEDHVVDTLAIVISVVVCLISVYPIYYCLINSFNEGKAGAQASVYFFPTRFTLDNYQVVFRNASLLGAFGMTVLRTLLGTGMAVVLMAMASYALTNRSLVFRRFYMVFGVVTLYFSASVVNQYILYRELTLLNSFWVYILPNLFQFYYMILFISFFDNLPPALLESARLDGANEFTVFFKILLPLSTPVIMTVALFCGVWHWNDWFHPAFFITSEKLMTLPAILMRAMSLAEAQQTMQKMMSTSAMQQSSSTMESVRYAMLIVAVAPITIIYPFIQKYFVKGMMIGSVKG